MRAGGVAVLLVLGVAVACGGRTNFLAPDRSDAASGSGGATSRGAGGKTARGGNSGVGGTLLVDLGGSASTLGGTGAGGSQNCICEMPDECAPGYYREQAPGQCCGGGPCVLDCRDLTCTEKDLDCREGMHVGTLPGDCCPSCVPDNPPCEVAKDLYQHFRADTLAKYGSIGCSPRGCAVASESNRCSETCGAIVPAVARDAIEEELSLYAEATCSACPLPTKPVCLPLPPLSCDVDVCGFDVPG